MNPSGTTEIETRVPSPNGNGIEHKKSSNGATIHGLSVEQEFSPAFEVGSTQQSLEELGHRLLYLIGEDPDREGLRETPRRWAKWWMDFIQYEPGKIETTFEAVSLNQVVVVSGIRVWSLCEHHLLPFWCDVSVGYLTKEKVLGLSKVARIAHQYAHRLQIQERLTNQIADTIEQITESPDVAVLARGEHLCMTMRGIKTPSIMASSVMRGIFRDSPSARQEFLELTRQTQQGSS